MPSQRLTTLVRIQIASINKGISASWATEPPNHSPKHKPPWDMWNPEQKNNKGYMCQWMRQVGHLLHSLTRVPFVSFCNPSVVGFCCRRASCVFLFLVTWIHANTFFFFCLWNCTSTDAVVVLSPFSALESRRNNFLICHVSCNCLIAYPQQTLWQ